MEYKDYYKALGVERTVGKEELKKQYRKLARQYHPDVNVSDKNAAAKFREINEAYEVLSDDAKRKKYDLLGADWEQHQNAGTGDHFDWTKYASPRDGQGTAGNWEDLFGNDSEASEFFRNIFGQAFGNRHGVRPARKGADLKAELSISLEEAYSGGVEILTIGDKRIRLKLKPGIWDRQTIKIAGKGAPGTNGAPNGDLYLTFLIQPHPEYRLDGIDLFKDIPVSVYSAALGASLEVKTISGTFKLKIPPETKNGTVLKLNAKGFPVYETPERYGDLYLRVALQLPEKLSPREKTLFRELAEVRHEKVEEEQP